MPESITIGNRYGKLVVIGRGGLDVKRNRLWACLCDCGNTAQVCTAELRCGSTKSCGCLRQDTRKRWRRQNTCGAALNRWLNLRRT